MAASLTCCHSFASTRPAGNNFGTGDALVVTSVTRFGGGRDDGRGQRVILVQAIGKVDAIDVAFTLAVAIPERGLGDAGNIAAHDHLDGQGCAGAHHCYIGVGQLKSDDWAQCLRFARTKRLRVG